MNKMYMIKQYENSKTEYREAHPYLSNENIRILNCYNLVVIANDGRDGNNKVTIYNCNFTDDFKNRIINKLQANQKHLRVYFNRCLFSDNIKEYMRISSDFRAYMKQHGHEDPTGEDFDIYMDYLNDR